MSYYVYFLTNKIHTVLYTGVTNNLERRLWEHKSGVLEEFSTQYKTFKLVYYEVFDDPENAIAREKQIKKWRRDKKDALIQKSNSEWHDLSEDWYKGDPSASPLRDFARDDSSSLSSRVKSSLNTLYPLWHPFTQHKTAGPMIDIARAQGAYLYTKDGRRIIDAISSWWVNVHGHCHPKIVEAVQKQAATLDQIIFAGFTHEPAQRLAEGLLKLFGGYFSHAFLSDSGSTAVEVALKMAIGYWHHKGEKRCKIVALEHGYHGDTFGAMAAGGRGVFNKIYEEYLFEVEHLPFPTPPYPTAGNDPSSTDPTLRIPPPGGGRLGGGENTIQAFEKILRQNNVAALIVEPLVLGAGGMLMYDANTLRAMLELCRRHGVISIADEVMTGFGRTGTMFACEQTGLWPDLMCLSKGLTSGFLPMGATLATREIYDAFYADERSKMFFHSSSFTGNPLSCAAALASLEIWKNEPVAERIQTIVRAHQQAAARFAQHGNAMNIRQCGTVLALDIGVNKAEYLDDLAPRLYDFFLSRGILLRPLGNTVYILPPYCVTQEDLEQIYDSIALALDHFRNGGSQQAA